MELQSKLALLPGIESAWARAEINSSQAWRLSLVAARETEADWLAHARSVTSKMLEAAVQRALVLAEEDHPTPPWNLSLGQLQLDWQEHFGLRRRRRLRVAEGACALEDEETVDEAPNGMRSASRLRRIGLGASAKFAAQWRRTVAAIRARVGTVLSDAEVVQVMVEHFIAVHVSDEVLAHARRHRAIERDGWICQMPHCRSRGPFHEHHVRYRSRGGGDEPWNLTTLCAPCHAMVHAGHVVVQGRAPDALTFILGTGRETYLGERLVECEREAAVG